MKRTLIALAVSGALMTSGCTPLASLTATAATKLSSSTPSQVTTLGDADLAADLLVQGGKVAVDTGKLSSGQLTELQALRAGVRKALDELHAANSANESLNFAAFNAALDAYRAYTTQQGIKS